MRKAEIIRLLGEYGLSTVGQVPLLRTRLKDWMRDQAPPAAAAGVAPDDTWQGFLPGVNPAHPGALPAPRLQDWRPSPDLAATLEAGKTSPAQLFAVALPDDVLGQVVMWTNLYVQLLLPGPAPTWYKGSNWPIWWVKELDKKRLTLDELRLALALSQLMGVVPLPQLQHYWSEKIPLFTSNFGSVMARDRYRAVMSALAFSDRRDGAVAALQQKFDGTGAYWKVAEFFEGFVHRLRGLVIPGEWCTLDEVVIKSWCLNSLHSRLRFKPAGSGSMRTTLHTSDGLLLGMHFPRKKKAVPPGSNQTSELVYDLVTSTLPPGSKTAADNLFNYIRLHERLYELGYHIFGTCRQNHMPPGVLAYFKTVKTQWEFKSAYKGCVYLFGWYDSTLCFFMSNLPDTENVEVVRFDRTAKTRHAVSTVTVAKKFNETKSGADLNDLMMANYPSHRPSPKWTRAWASWVFDQARVWAYLVGKKLVPRLAGMTHLDFILDLCQSFIRGPANPLLELAGPGSKRGRTRSSTPKKRTKPNPSPTKRLNHNYLMMHTSALPADHPLSGKSLRCVLCHQKDVRREVKTFCAVEGCGVFLCMLSDHHNLWHQQSSLVE
jgi:hypothetical protein